MTPERPQKFKVKSQRSRSQRDVTRAKICQIVNNSAESCSISIKFSTDYDHVTPDLPQTFRPTGQSLKGQGHTVTRRITVKISSHFMIG